jgi:hypothetical protein
MLLDNHFGMLGGGIMQKVHLVFVACNTSISLRMASWTMLLQSNHHK